MQAISFGLWITIWSQINNINLCQLFIIGRILAMQKLFKNCTLLVSLLLVVFILQSCMSTRIAELERLEKIRGTEILSEYTYAVSTIKNPNINSPILKIKVQRTPKYKIRSKQIFSEESYFDYSGTGWLIGLTFAGIGIAMLSAGGSDFMTVGGAGAVGMGLVGGIVFSSKEDNQGWRTGNYIEGNIVDDKETGRVENYPNTNLAIESNEKKITYESDHNGEIIINLVKDFGLKRFQKPKTIKLRALAVDKRINKEFYLKSKDWTIPFITINRNGIAVETEKGGELVKLGELKTGEEYKILHEGDELIKINFNGEEGYIEKNSGEKFWAVKNYLDLTK